MKTFDLPLRTSIVPAYAAGSATPTFTRASAATVVDHEGIVRYCKSGEARFWGARRVENLMWPGQGSEGNSAFTTTGSVTITGDQIGPLGTVNAIKVVYGASGSGNRIQSSFVGPSLLDAAAYRYFVSVWLRGEVGGESMRLGDGWSTTVPIVLTTDWQRYALLTPGGFISAYPLVYADSGTPTIYATMAQSEVATGASVQAPGEYVSVGVLSAPYHGAGADGVKYFDTANGNSVASNVVSEGIGAPIATTCEGVYSGTLWQQGYLCEPQITNRLLYSEDFSNAAWAKTNVTVTADSTAAPDGATTADTLTATAANGTVIQDLGVVASAKKTGSLWLKRKTGSGNIQLTMDGGTGWTTVAVGADWTRFPITQTLADEDFGVRIVTSGDEVYAWGGQIEQANGWSGGAWMTTYVPTTSAAVQRKGDALTFPTTGNISLAAGTVAARLTLDGITRWNERVVGLGGGNWAPMTQNEWVSIYDGVNSTVTPPSNVDLHAATVWQTGGNKQAFANNLQSTANAFNGTLIGTTIQVNGSGGDEAGSKPIRDLRIWNQVMPIDANGDVVEASGSPSGGAVLRALRQKYMRERDERERADREFYARLEAGEEQ